MAIEMSRASDEIGHIERKKTVAIETAWIMLRQHKGFAATTIGINMTEIGPRKETVVSTGAKHNPARVGAPVVE